VFVKANIIDYNTIKDLKINDIYKKNKEDILFKNINNKSINIPKTDMKFCRDGCKIF